MLTFQISFIQWQRPRALFFEFSQCYLLDTGVIYGVRKKWRKDLVRAFLLEGVKYPMDTLIHTYFHVGMRIAQALNKIPR